ncbi:hypothetical protein D3C85_1320260 [compost metagenome]
MIGNKEYAPATLHELDQGILLRLFVRNVRFSNHEDVIILQFIISHCLLPKGIGNLSLQRVYGESVILKSIREIGECPINNPIRRPGRLGMCVIEQHLLTLSIRERYSGCRCQLNLLYTAVCLLGTCGLRQQSRQSAQGKCAGQDGAKQLLSPCCTHTLLIPPLIWKIWIYSIVIDN